MNLEIFSPKKEEVASIKRFKIQIHRVRDVVVPITKEENGQLIATWNYLYCNEKDYAERLKKDSQPRCVVCNYGFERHDLYFHAYYNRDHQLCIREKPCYDKACVKCGLKRLAQITPKSLLTQYKDYIKTIIPKV